jgi:hypothetical protein
MAADPSKRLASSPATAAEKNLLTPLLESDLADVSLRELLSFLLSSVGSAERKAYLERVASDRPNGFRSASLALPTARPNTPAADFRAEFRMDRSIPSRVSATGNGPPEVSSTAFCAQPPNLRFTSLIDMGFAIICPLARRSRLKSASCTLARAFALRFLQTSPRDDALALGYHFTSIKL